MLLSVKITIFLDISLVRNIYDLLEMMKKSIVVHGIIKINTLAASVPVPRLNEEK